MTRQEIEKQIARKVVDDALAAGYTIDVFDGEEFAVKNSTDAEQIFAAMFSTDDDRLFLTRDGKTAWVWFIYGNSGWDVISDYNVSLEEVLKGAMKLADELEDKLDA
ncbi:hypothetical protein J4G48_0040670 [Bradyrhizobium barranii subsp. apii]|uniref:hypothetical protein n=1 Tax=Bradyrhizobium barranii TaxID=2992140 RepID=UPI001CD2DAD7|nr:hypothetical protein [Bradyrhizobium barranii]UPT95471.1 hypothetical protein J4G48_0040670 [Bradyrhizobium barranii subsp. apii]